MGKQERSSHVSQRALHTWCLERVAHEEDLVFQECTARFSTEELDASLNGEYLRITVQFRPAWGGQ